VYRHSACRWGRRAVGWSEPFSPSNILDTTIHLNPPGNHAKQQRVCNRGRITVVWGNRRDRDPSSHRGCGRFHPRPNAQPSKRQQQRTMPHRNHTKGGAKAKANTISSIIDNNCTHNLSSSTGRRPCRGSSSRSSPRRSETRKQQRTIRRHRI